MTTPAPKSIKQVNESTLGITWSDGHDSIYSVKNLRENCPCAHCIDEWSGKKMIAPGAITDDIKTLRQLDFMPFSFIGMTDTIPGFIHMNCYGNFVSVRPAKAKALKTRL